MLNENDVKDKTLEDMLFAITTPIYINGSSDITGSGFFYFESRQSDIKAKRYQDIWIVTNWHVLFGLDRSKPEKLSIIRFRTRKKTSSGSPSWNEIVLKDKDFHNKIKFSEDLNEDVVAFKVTDEIEKLHPNLDNEYGFFAVSEILLPEKSLGSVEAGDDVIVIGYPGGMYDEENLFPIIRSSCIATRWGSRVNGFRYFLLDRKHLEGSSGSLVITKPAIVRASTTKQFLFLGVYEGELKRGYWSTDTGKVWYGSLVEQIIKNGKVWIC